MVLDFRRFLHTTLDVNLNVKDGPLSLHSVNGKLSTMRDIFRFGALVDGKPVFHSVLQCFDMKEDGYIQALVMPSGLRAKLARSISQSPVAIFRHFFDESILQGLFDQPALAQGASDVYDP